MFIVSVVIDRELTISSTSISNLCNALLFKLLLGVLRSAFRMVLAVLICCSQTLPTWLAVGEFLTYVIQLALCVWRYCYIWLWFISWKAFQSLLIAPTKLVPLWDLIRQMLPRLPINLLNESINESVSTTAWLHKHINTTPYLFYSFL